jgi:aspartyl protease family protein
MYKALLFVVAAGVAIGLAIPSSNRSVEAAAVASDGTPRETLLEREANGHFYVHAKVNGELVRFLVDTGASGVSLTEKDARRVGIQFSPSEFEEVAQGAAGPIRGKLVTIKSVEVDGKKVTNVRGAVLQGSDLSLLGQSYLSRIGEVEMRGDYMVLR